jgi:oxygen-independent coproporphyrinogen-3 oxidase
MRGVNLDLVYGLPYQSAESFADTLDRTFALRPARVAVYAYAHLPKLRRHQARIDAAALPAPSERLLLAEAARIRFLEAGYEAIGMDHFALPDDELTIAQREGRLSRDFMGYTTRDTELVGLGMSAISELDAAYVQQWSNLGHWWKAVEAGAPVVERGWALSDDDRVRREIIRQVMCNFALSFSEVEARVGQPFAEAFRQELATLRKLEDEGWVTLAEAGLTVTHAGRLRVRNIAAVFDQYLASGRATYSQAV